MAAGRCAGCGQTDSIRKIQIHVNGCREFIDLFRVNPERCLDPVAEYDRYKAEDDSPEARAERRDGRLQQRFADLDQRQTRAAQRWSPERDILAD